MEQVDVMLDEPNTATQPLDPEFLAMLRCPACADRPPVRLAPEGGRLLCDRCGRAYPILDGIPSLLVDEDETLEEGRS